MKLDEILLTEEKAKEAFNAILESNRENLLKLFSQNGNLKNTYDEQYETDAGKTFFSLNDDICFLERTPGAGDYCFNITIQDNENNNVYHETYLDDLSGPIFWKAAGMVYETIQNAIETAKASRDKKLKLVQNTYELLTDEMKFKLL